ncbi:acyl carrier protein [Salinispora arenicola]|uniref:acyl carrier protein n=1 Tax=Salinispora arenicola TaxID=168697 RepID=UPI0016B52BC9|nr:non-ribosomal peptide synthetase [Salinispora arenicola]NIL64936.1 hypothetical protein [Salinispora arenicola]
MIDALPLSGNGKVDRSALPDPVTGSGAPVTATPDALVQDVRARIARLLRVDPERLPVGAPLPSIGIDSLRAIELRNELKRDHRVVLPIRTLLSSSLTIAQARAGGRGPRRRGRRRRVRVATGVGAPGPPARALRAHRPPARLPGRPLRRLRPRRRGQPLLRRVRLPRPAPPTGSTRP